MMFTFTCLTGSFAATLSCSMFQSSAVKTAFSQLQFSSDLLLWLFFYNHLIYDISCYCIHKLLCSSHPGLSVKVFLFLLDWVYACMLSNQISMYPFFGLPKVPFLPIVVWSTKSARFEYIEYVFRLLHWVFQF